MNLLNESGMSIGDFKTSGGTPTNKYGKFEAYPFLELNKYFQNLLYGFSDDIPEDSVSLESLKDIDIGHPELAVIPGDKFESARRFIEQLTGSARVTGCKDPRMVLTWPVWKGVLSQFENIKVYPVILVRSPHEIAMSLFLRSKGQYSYEYCLDVIYISYRMLNKITGEFSNQVPVLCFGTPVYKARMQKIISELELVWNEDTFNKVYDINSVHQKYASINHPSQDIFDQFDSGIEDISDKLNLEIIRNDEIKRNSVLRLKKIQPTNNSFADDKNLFLKLKSRLIKYFL